MNRLKRLYLFALACFALPATAADPLVERGRYLVQVTGCNDCHTAGYMEKQGEVPEADWLLGSNVGWRGDWGTTYATNLRLYMQPLGEEQWLTIARNKPSRPPMPWYALRDMRDDDLRALYRYIKQLGPAGRSVPGFVPPDQEPATAFILMQPQEAGVGERATRPQAAEAPAEKESSFWDFDFKPAKPRTSRPGH